MESADNVERDTEQAPVNSQRGSESSSYSDDRNEKHEGSEAGNENTNYIVAPNAEVQQQNQQHDSAPDERDSHGSDFEASDSEFSFLEGEDTTVDAGAPAEGQQDAPSPDLLQEGSAASGSRTSTPAPTRAEQAHVSTNLTADPAYSDEDGSYTSSRPAEQGERDQGEAASIHMQNEERPASDRSTLSTPTFNNISLTEHEAHSPAISPTSTSRRSDPTRTSTASTSRVGTGLRDSLPPVKKPPRAKHPMDNIDPDFLNTDTYAYMQRPGLPYAVSWLTFPVLPLPCVVYCVKAVFGCHDGCTFSVGIMIGS